MQDNKHSYWEHSLALKTWIAYKSWKSRFDFLDLKINQVNLWKLCALLLAAVDTQFSFCSSACYSHFLCFNIRLHVVQQDIDGNDVSLSKYKGKVLLIVNVASRWYVHLFIGALWCTSFVTYHGLYRLNSLKYALFFYYQWSYNFQLQWIRGDLQKLEGSR